MERPQRHVPNPTVTSIINTWLSMAGRMFQCKLSDGSSKKVKEGEIPHLEKDGAGVLGKTSQL